MRTGFFGNPLRSTKVHVVDEHDKPICGSKIGIDMDFQWCAGNIKLDYIECEKCKNKAIKILINENFDLFRPTRRFYNAKIP